MSPLLDYGDTFQSLGAYMLYNVKITEFSNGQVYGNTSYPLGDYANCQNGDKKH